MTKYLPLVIAAILITGCNQLKPNQFKVIGEVTGYKDSTIIYFQIDQKQDSTFIIDNKFTVTGTLPRAPYQMILHVKDTRDYKIFWLEKSEMSFKADKDAFDNAKITGSKTQLLQDELDVKTNVFYKQLKSLSKQPGLSAKEKGIKQDALFKKATEAYIAFIKENPGSIISADYLSTQAGELGRAKTQELYNMLSPEMKATDEGKTTLKFLTLNKDIEIGKPFVDFTQYDAEGKPVKLSDFKGNVILLDFWASWCGPCRNQNPQLVNTYNVYKNNGFKIVAVSVDENKKEWLDAVKKDRLPYTNVSEKNGGKNSADIIYGIQKYPSNFLIDSNGIVIAKDIEGEDLGKALTKLYHINGH